MSSLNQMEIKTTRVVNVDSADHLSSLFGNYDENVRVIEEELGVEIKTRDTQIVVAGDPSASEVAEVVVRKLIGMISRRESVDKTRIRYAVGLARAGKADLIETIPQDVVAITSRGKPVRCKTLGQKQYVEAMRRNTLTFAIGPAGTGKTYLAMCMAVVALKNKEVERIILTRPAVEAGERLGFLPGDLQSKVDPYLRPLYDALHELLGAESYARLQERGQIEVAPLAYMRGRTLSDAYIILDEAQNTTQEQMKMFLTRFGFGSKVVVTGDTTQIDLPDGRRSGLLQAVDVLRGIENIAVSQLTHRDVVRHELVQLIVRAYEKADRRER